MSNENHLARVEAFSDGVFAIASTLSVLEIRVPPVGVRAPLGELWRALADLWPSYLAFVLSFGTILVIWVNHHNGIRTLTKSSSGFLYANGLLLLTVTFMPFPTALLAKYFETPLAPVVVVFYACSGLLINAAFLVWFGAMQRPVYLFRPDLGRGEVRRTWMQIGSGIPGYVVAAIVGWWLPSIGLMIIVTLHVLWIAMSIRGRISSRRIA